MAYGRHLFPNILQGLEDSTTVEDLVLNLVLPVSMAGSVNHEAVLINKEEQETILYGKRFELHMQILTGSSAEGLGVPEVTHISEQWTSAADEDVKYVFTSLLVDSHHRMAFARMDTQQAHPGFTRLLFNPEWLVKRRSENYTKFNEQAERKVLKNPKDYTSNDGYILRKKLTGILRKSIRDAIHSVEKEISLTNAHVKAHTSVHFSQHGPAITVELREYGSCTIHSKDYVVALPCPSWPDTASEWLTRTKVWPSKQQVRQIASKGCHIVPKGHHSNKDPAEFNISFSATEKQVAMCLNIYQKRVYMLLKFLFKYHLNKANRGLTTYHLKTTLFHLCERLSPEHWTEYNPYTCLQRLLHDLEEYITMGVLPHYFIKESNLIDFMTKPTSRVLCKDLQAVRGQCWSTILQLTGMRRFCWLSKDILLPQLLQPMLSHPEERLSQVTAQNTVASFVTKLLQKAETYVAISLICGSTNCEVLPPTDQIIACLEAVIDSERLDQGSKLSFNGLLATLYHQLGKEMNEQNKIQLCEKYMTKSSDLFENTMPRVEEELWITASYYNLLSAGDKHADMVRHFIQHLHQSDSTMDLYTGGVYTRVQGYNRLTTDETFIAAAQMSQFIVPSIAYIFYKVYKSLMILCDTCKGRQLWALNKFAASILKDFKHWASNKFSKYQESICDEHILILLALCEKLGGKNKMADKLFQEAVDYNGVYMPNTDQLLYEEMPMDRLKSLTVDELRSHPYHCYRPIIKPVNSQSLKILSEKVFKYRKRQCILKEFVHF